MNDPEAIDLSETEGWYDSTPWIDFTGDCPVHRGNIFKKTNGLCGFCGEQPAMSIDHIVPKSKRGSTMDPRNLVGACLDCNSAKADMLLEEFRDRFFCECGGSFYFEKI